jgi:hypothetical protein
LQVLGGIVGPKPSEQCGGGEAEVDEARAGEGDLEIGFQRRIESVDDLLGQGARVLLLAFGEGKGAVGLKIAMGWFGHANLRFEPAGKQSEQVGGATKSRSKMVGDVKGKSHPDIEELRLLLSKNDYRG